jgi:hypothetical protein
VNARRVAQTTPVILAFAMDLEARLHDLHQSLGEFKSDDKASWQVGVIFNVLLDEVKKAHADDPVVAVIEPAVRTRGTSGPGNHATVTFGTLRASTSQLLTVVQGS